MHRLTFAVLSLVAAIGILAGASHWWQTNRFLVSTNNAYVHAEITTVSSRLEGHISKVMVEDNQRVTAGELLAEIDRRKYEAVELRAQAALHQSRSQIASLQARKILQSSLIRQAEAEVSSRLAELEGVDQTLVRLRSLRAQDYAALDALDRQEIIRKEAVAQLAKARAQHTAARAQLSVLNSEDEQLAAQVLENEAELELARIDLDNTRIKSPISGIVGKRSLRLGQYVQASTPLVSIVPDQPVWVEANFKETQVEHFRAGQKVTLEIDAFPGHPLESSIHSLSPATGARFSLLPPENATGNFTKIVQRVPVRINLPPTHPLTGRLVPGMSVVVTVDTRE
jgi:membrane fusion protein (multidrug efflux system)